MWLAVARWGDLTVLEVATDFGVDDLGKILVQFPEVAVAANIEGTVADGWCTKDGFLEIEGINDLALALGCIDNLTQASFIKAVKVFTCSYG